MLNSIVISIWPSSFPLFNRKVDWRLVDVILNKILTDLHFDFTEVASS